MAAPSSTHAKAASVPVAGQPGASFVRPAMLAALYALLVLLVTITFTAPATRYLIATALAAVTATLAVAPALWAATLATNRRSIRRWRLNAAAIIVIAAAELLAVFHALSVENQPPPRILLVFFALGGLLGFAASALLPASAPFAGMRARTMIDAALAAAALVLFWIAITAQLRGVEQATASTWALATVALVAMLAATGANALAAIGGMERREAGLLAAGWFLLTVAAFAHGIALLRASASSEWAGWIVPPAAACLALAALEEVRHPETVAAESPGHSPAPAPWPLRERGVAAVAVPYLVFGAAVALAVLQRDTAALTPVLVTVGLGIAALIVTRQALGARIEEQLTDALETARADLQRQATIDPVTELPNRRALMERLGEEVERAMRYTDPLSVCFVDIDRFKAINDTYGHRAGDMVLREVGMLLRRSARTVDFVGRYGGEEFVIVLPETWSDDAMVMAERTRRLVHGHRFTLPTGESVRLSISAGIAGLPEHASDLPTLLERADRALYAAKAGGRNRVVLFEPEEDRILLNP